MHIIRILREYLGYSQKELAVRAGISASDLCEMENLEPYGKTEKYQRVADYLGVSIHALVANDCRMVPLSFFEKNKSMAYKNASSYINIANGRAGEEFVMERERERVAKFSPVLARLILPYYKMSKNPGFDILSFDEDGHPIYIEVKTTYAERRNAALLSQKERDRAEALFQQGNTYQVHSLTNWKKKNQTYTIYDYEDLRTKARMIPTEYMFILDPVKKISGIAYQRQKTGMNQNELADVLGISQSKMHLSNAKYMNDQLEYQNGDSDIWGNLFFSCFMMEEDESIGMWSMYAQPWRDGVKISIPKVILRRWVDETKELIEISQETKQPTGKTISDTNAFKIWLSAVAYSNYDGLNLKEDAEVLRCGTQENTILKNVPHRPELTGYIKDMAWAYEKEIRVKTQFNNDVGFDRVAIKMPDYVIESMIITPSPLFEGDLVERIESEIRLQMQTSTSKFVGKLKIRSACDSCSIILGQK